MPPANSDDRPRATDDERAAFGARVRSARKGLKLTQEALARQVGTTSQTLRSWENGRSGITEPMMDALTRALGVQADDLWAGWDPTLANWGGRRTEREPTPARLDRLEAEIIALRAELVAKEVLEPSPASTASELTTHLERLAEQADQRDDASTAPPSAAPRRQSQ